MPLAVAVLAAILGQSGAAPAAPLLRRVDEGVSDRDPLVASLKIPITDLRVPTGFEGVYQAASAEGHDVFVRRSGAIWAVFPRGVYSRSEGRTLVGMPPGMSFSIGVPRSLRPVDPIDPEGRGDRAVHDAHALAPDASAAPGATRLDFSSDVLAEQPRTEQRLLSRVDHSAEAGSSEGIASTAGASSPALLQAAPATERRATSASHFVTRALGGHSSAADERSSMPRFAVDEQYRRARLDALLRERRDNGSAPQ